MRDIERIVGKYKGVYDKPPAQTPTNKMPDGPLLGNGDIGVTLGGAPDELRLFISKADFWKTQGPPKCPNTSAGPRLLGQIVLLTPQLKGGAYHFEQILYTAEGVGRFQAGNATLEMRTWVAATQNTVVVELTARGAPLPIKAQFWTQRSDGATGENTAEGRCFVSTTRYNAPDIVVPCEAAMACASLGTSLPVDKEGLAGCTLEPGRTLRFVACVATNHEAPDYSRRARALAAAVDETSLETLRTAHRKWWSDFWSESFVEIGDELIEKYYYGAQYIMASCSRNASFPPGLYGIWTTTDRPEWNGDYHTNYNQEAAYWGLYSSNHIAISVPYDAPILDYLETGRQNARELLHCRGVYYEVGLGPKGFCSTMFAVGDDNPCAKADQGHMFWGQKSNAAFASANMFIRYFHTYDRDYARKVYPYLLAVGDFWEDYLRLENGRYVINNDAFHEAGWWEGADWAKWRDDKNNALSLGLVRMVFGGLIKISEDLNVDANRRDKWRDILARISDWPLKEVNGNKTFLKAESGRGSTHVGAASWLMWGTVFPAGVVGRDTRDDLCEIFRRECDGLDWDNGNAFCHVIPGAARAGIRPELILERIRARIAGSGLPNLLVFQGGGGIETCGGMMAGINEMLLQSYEFVIRVFPNWPRDKPARFGSLRAVGAFLVSSQLRGGYVQHIDILSEKGRECLVENPWPGRHVSVRQQGPGNERPIEVRTSGRRIAFSTEAGGIYRLTPIGAPAPLPATILQELLLANSAQIRTDGTFVQATRFGNNSEDLTAFGIKWSKWPGSPAAKYHREWGKGQAGAVDAKGDKFTGDAGELMKWVLGPNYGSISGTFSDLIPGKRYRAQFIVNEDHVSRDLAILVAGASTGSMFGYTNPLVVTFEWTSERTSEPWSVSGANGNAVGFALYQLPDPVKRPMAAEVRALPVIPAPKSCKLTGGNMALTPRSRIVAAQADLLPLAKILAAEIGQLAGLDLPVSGESARAGDIVLAIDRGMEGEAYALDVSDRATVKARHPAALAQGSVTLLQALSPRDAGVILPHMTVRDVPAVGYRGLMIDCARNWHSIRTLKQMVVLCRWYKIRYLQLHLSDDESFTFPSTAYPALATKDRHYSLEELRDLEVFARNRGVTIIPELDVPGHATALVKALPQIFGAGGNVIAAGREETYKALDALVGEVCDVFRSTPYVHIGADEVNKGGWNNPETAAYMAAHKIADTEELYRHFVVRMNEIVKAHGKKTIVWEGFAKGGKIEIPRDITVMAYEIAYYQPDELVKDGYNIINASWTPLYVVNANCRMPEEIYAWNLFQFKKFKAPAADPGVNVTPTPQVLGAQMCAWEQPELQELPSLRHRLPAMSERVWNPDAGRTVADFTERLRAADAGLSLLMP